MKKGKKTKKRKKRLKSNSKKIKAAKRKRVNSNSTKRPTKKRKISGKDCSKALCTHERCHHFRLVDYLVGQRKLHEFYFNAALFPYHSVPTRAKYGIRLGEPDFFISLDYECPIGDKRFIGLVIELKTGRGTLTPDEVAVLRDMIRKGRYLVAVCFGYEACKKLFMAYRGCKPWEIVQELCWAGNIKKEYVLGSKNK